MKKLLLVFCTLFYFSQIFAQLNEQSTIGKTPPIGVNVVGHISDSKNVTSQQIISGVPYYLWRYGCGPTSVGMVAGYYALHGCIIIFTTNYLFLFGQLFFLPVVTLNIHFRL